MIIQRLIAWFRFQRPQPLQRLTVLEAAGDQKTVLDLTEFGRLLRSGRREDLKKIAQVMSQPDRGPTASFGPTSRHQIKPNMSDRVKGGAGSIEMPTQLHWAALADTGPGGFQDR
jgi:hypothetical protein